MSKINNISISQMAACDLVPAHKYKMPDCIEKGSGKAIWFWVLMGSFLMKIKYSTNISTD